MLQSRSVSLVVMARTDDADASVPPTFSGEVWTDARGYATVALPRLAGRSHGNLEYELSPATPNVSATVAAQLVDGRFTIATDEPHVKVTWKVTAQTATREEE